MVSKLIFVISTFKWGGTTALDPDRVDRRGYHVYQLTLCGHPVSGNTRIGQQVLYKRHIESHTYLPKLKIIKKFL